MNRDPVRVIIQSPPPGPKARKWAEYHRRYAALSTYHEGFIGFPYCTCRDHPCNCGWTVCCTGKEGLRSRLDHYLDPEISFPCGCPRPRIDGCH